METTTVTREKFLDQSEMLSVLKEIGVFTDTPEFQKLLADLRSQPTLNDRHRFVKEVVINKKNGKKEE
jgi:hypothetical protein